GIWIAIEDATRDNGCLWMQPGQHRTPLREIYEVDWTTRTGTLKPLDDKPWVTGEPVPLEVAAGSAVIFNDHMPHYSSQNTSDSSRHAFTLHVSERDSPWPEENWIQRPRLGSFEL
ncbi:MAG: phytanoyl-CoA dioxygenase family protein, partial [Gammaproteobacteria bacterium]|nr:phytanoyl-CoA dioxygenase family protein [Gammaproteobacteria bacterium]